MENLIWSSVLLINCETIKIRIGLRWIDEKLKKKDPLIQEAYVVLGGKKKRKEKKNSNIDIEVFKLKYSIKK